MKKITLILTLILCITFSSKAQITSNLLFVNTLAMQQVDQTDKVSKNNDEVPKFILSGKKLTAKNIEIGTQVDIFSVLGAKVYSFIYTGESVSLNLNRGIYIIKANKHTQKILFQ